MVRKKKKKKKKKVKIKGKISFICNLCREKFNSDKIFEQVCHSCVNTTSEESLDFIKIEYKKINKLLNTKQINNNILQTQRNNLRDEIKLLKKEIRTMKIDARHFIRSLIYKNEDKLNDKGFDRNLTYTSFVNKKKRYLTKKEKSETILWKFL
jgi:hypothetical protein